MKNFDNVKMVLFDSTNAKFKLAVEASFTRRKEDGTYRDLVYIASYTANLNPNIYVTLSYKSDDLQNPARAVYMSYPQLFRVREAMKKVADMVADESGFSRVNNTLVVKPGCDAPINVTNIGKGNNWISFKLVTVDNGENGVSEIIPAVSISLSPSHPDVSVLTVEEFLTVYTIISDLDLASYQCMLSLAFLDTNRNSGQVQQQAYMQPQPGYYVPASAYGQSVPAAQPTYYTGRPQPNGGYQPQPAQPRYNNGGYKGRQNYQQPAAPQPVPAAPTADETPVITPRQPAPAPQGLAPRPSTGGLKSAVEATPISPVDFDDITAVDALFDE